MKITRKKVLSFTLMIALALSAKVNAQNNVANAVKLISQEKYEAAKKMLLDVIAQTPKDGKAYFYLGEVNYKQYKADSTDTRNSILASAKNCYLGGIKKDKRFDLNYYGAAKALFAENKADSVATLIEKGLDYTKDKEDVNELLNAVDIYLEIGNKDYAKAKEILDVANELDRKLVKDSKGKQKRNARIFIAYGDLYTLMGNTAKAIESYKSATSFDENYADGYYYYGMYYVKGNAFEAAEEQFQNAVKCDPTYAKAFRELAGIYYLKALESRKQNKEVDNSNYKKFKEYYENYLQFSEKTLDNQLYYAQRAVLFDDYDNAIAIANTLNNQFPNNFKVLRILAFSYATKGDMKNAIETYNKFMSIAPKDKITAGDYEKLARYYADAKTDKAVFPDKADKAAELFKKVVELSPERVELYRDIAMTYKAENNLPKALEYFEMLVAKGKPISQDFFIFGNVYMNTKEYVKAEAAFEQLIKLRPDEAMAYYFKANAMVYADTTLKGKESALPTYNKFLELAKPEKNAQKIAEVNSSLGFYFYQLLDQAVKVKAPVASVVKENATKAEEYLAKAKAIDPSNANVQMILDEIGKLKTNKKYQKLFK